MTFQHWSEDLQLLASWLKSRSPNLPLVLHGLEMGALLAGIAFQAGVGDVLLLWSPPANANLALRPTLLRWVVADQLFKFGDDRRPASAYFQKMEEGLTIEVEGYRWTAKLWRDSHEVKLPSAMEDENRARAIYHRPVRVVRLGKDAIPLIKGGNAVTNEPRNYTSLFAKNWGWLAGALAIDGGGSE
jgi:hypothetical protein